MKEKGKLTFKDVTVRRGAVGQAVLSCMYRGYRYQRTFIGYGMAQAKRLFIRSVVHSA